MVPHSLADLLFRLAEHPRLYSPRWTEDILDEVHRNHIKQGLPSDRADSWRKAVNEAFPEAMVTGHRPLVEVCTNEHEDRHVLAAAIKAPSQTIVTANVRDFPLASTAPWNVEIVRPGDYLVSLYELAPAVVMSKLDDIATKKGRSREENLAFFNRIVPTFAHSVATDLGITL